MTEFSAKIQDSLNTFNKENAEYQIQFQKSINEFEKDFYDKVQEKEKVTIE